MNLNITGHHVEVTPAIRDYVTAKLDRQVLKYKTKAADHGHDSLKNHVAES